MDFSWDRFWKVGIISSFCFYSLRPIGLAKILTAASLIGMVRGEHTSPFTAFFKRVHAGSSYDMSTYGNTFAVLELLLIGRQ